MALIYRSSDRIKLKIEDIEIKISPLTMDQKMEIQQLITDGKPLSAAKASIRYGLKEISGLECMDGNKYALEFENDGLKEECIDDLMNTKYNEYIIDTCLKLLNGVPELEDVVFEKEKASTKKPKKRGV